MTVPLVVVDRRGLIANDSLAPLQAILERNRGECELPNATLTRQVLDLVMKSLADCHAHTARFPNGEEVDFVREFCLPTGVIPESVKRTLDQRRTRREQAAA